MVRVTLVTTTYPPENGWGGIGTYVYNLARGLGEIGCEVTVICGYAGRPQVRREDGLSVHAVLNQEPAAEALDRQVLRVLAPLIAAGHTDVVEFPEIGAFGLSFQKIFPNFPVVVRLHGDSEHLHLGRVPPAKRAALAIMSRVRLLPSWLQVRSDAEKESARRAHAVVSPSEWMLRSCLSRGWQFPDLRLVAPNPVIIEREEDAVGPRHSSRHVLWLGRLEPLKGIDLLPAIAERIWAAAPETIFHLVGQPTPRGSSDWGEWLMRRIPPGARSRIVMHGGLRHDQVCREVTRFPIAIFASTWESYSYTIAECMASGVACVTASEGGAREIGENGKSLFQVERRPASIARAALFLIASPEVAKCVGRHARQFARRHCTHTLVAEQMRDVYMRAAESAARRTDTARLSPSECAAAPQSKPALDPAPSAGFLLSTVPEFSLAKTEEPDWPQIDAERQ